MPTIPIAINDVVFDLNTRADPNIKSSLPIVENAVVVDGDVRPVKNKNAIIKVVGNDVVLDDAADRIVQEYTSVTAMVDEIAININIISAARVNSGRTSARIANLIILDGRIVGIGALNANAGRP